MTYHRTHFPHYYKASILLDIKRGRWSRLNHFWYASIICLNWSFLLQELAQCSTRAIKSCYLMKHGQDRGWEEWCHRIQTSEIARFGVRWITLTLIMRMGKDLIKMIRSSCVEPGTNRKRRKDLNSKRYLKGNPTLCKRSFVWKQKNERYRKFEINWNLMII